jgi:dTDP-4-dehydrorhamnose 3,5-epimerase
MAIKEYHDLPGVKTYDLSLFPDERGYFSELLRTDWKDLLGEDPILQVNSSLTYPGIIRAWHRHIRGQNDNFLVLQGALKICAYDDRNESPGTKGKLIEIVVSSHKPQIVRVPGFYWHGFKNVSNEPSLLVYFVNKLYDPQNPDEERRPWNDPTILDPRDGKPFDWNKPPHK